MKKLYPKYDPGTYHTRELFRIVCETRDLRPVWAHKNANKWKVDPAEYLKLCGETCACCGSQLDYGLGQNNQDKSDVNTPSTDHIKPRSEGGTNAIENLCIICNRCNLLKNNSTPDDIHRYKCILETLEQINSNKKVDSTDLT
jgi:hypothetical protein